MNLNSAYACVCTLVILLKCYLYLYSTDDCLKKKNNQHVVHAESICFIALCEV